MMSLTTSPIEITPTTLPASSTGRWRKPRSAINAMQPSSRSSGLTVTGLLVITWPTGVCFASSPGSSTLMAQSPWVTIPTSTSSSMTSTDRTRLSRIWRKASTTMSPERTWIRAPLFWARAFFTVLIDLLSWALSCPALKDSRNILPRQDSADVAGEACYRSRQRDFHRLDDVNLQHLHHFQLEDADGILHGANPGEIPSIRSTNSSSRSTSRPQKQIGLTVPSTLLACQRRQSGGVGYPRFKRSKHWHRLNGCYGSMMLKKPS